MKRLVLLFAAVIAVCSCERGMIESLPLDQNTLTFSASWAEEEFTKTELQSNETSIWWNANDKINVFYGNEYSGEFTSSNTEPAAQTTFMGELSGTPTDGDNAEYWAVYPYNENNTCDGESVVLTVPSEQNGVAGTFANGLFPAIAKSNGTDLSFYNVCGGARFNVTQEGITSVVFKSNNGEALTGKVQVAFGDDGKPYIKSIVDPVDSVIVYAPEGGFVVGENFFAVMLPQSLTKGITTSLYKSNSPADLSINTSVVINRSRFGILDEIDMDIVFPPLSPEAVDLGLSVKWASFNLGASKPEEYGDYYAWGEIETKSTYNWSTYKWCDGTKTTLTKYCHNSSFGYNGFTDEKAELDSEDDVAYVTLGSKWRMPTSTEIEELFVYCTWTSTVLNGVSGRLLTGPNGNSIFLPAAGYRDGARLRSEGSGYYWSSTLPPDYSSCAWSVNFYSSWECVTLNRYEGLSVRPVYGERVVKVSGIGVSPTEAELEEGETLQLTAMIYPANAAQQALSWSSSDATIASVDDSGLVRAIAAGSATITATTVDGGFTASCSLTVLSTITVPLPQAVDLGLSVKWASFNVGASSPEEYGNYYSWGELKRKGNYDWSTYRYCKGYLNTITKYCGVSSFGYNGYTDNKMVLEMSDDVARVKLGGSWRMPTDAEWTELRTKCTWTWTNDFNGTGVHGRIVTATNGNSIFLPAAGYRNGTFISYEGSYGDYWSSSLYTDYPSEAWHEMFNSSSYNSKGTVSRYRGQSVRPVYK